MQNNKTKTISVILQPEMVAELEKLMKKEQRTMSGVVRVAIQRYIDENKGE